MLSVLKVYIISMPQYFSFLAFGFYVCCFSFCCCFPQQPQTFLLETEFCSLFGKPPLLYDYSHGLDLD